MRDRHPRARDRLPRTARAAMGRVCDRAGQGPPSRIPRPVLQRRVRDRARGRDGHPQASQGRAAAPGRALGDPAQRLGSVDRALWQGARCVLSGRRHRDRADRDHDGQRGLVPGERARAGDERLRDRLPRAVPRAGRDERHVLGSEPRPGARQQHVRDRDEPRDLLPRQGLGDADRHVLGRVADRRLPRPGGDGGAVRRRLDVDRRARSTSRRFGASARPHSGTTG